MSVASPTANGQNDRKHPNTPAEPPPTPQHTTPPPGARTLPPQMYPTPTACQHWGQGGWEEGQNSHTPEASPHSAGGTATSRPLRPQTSNNTPHLHRTQRTYLLEGTPRAVATAAETKGVLGCLSVEQLANLSCRRRRSETCRPAGESSTSPRPRPRGLQQPRLHRRWRRPRRLLLAAAACLASAEADDPVHAHQQVV